MKKLKNVIIIATFILSIGCATASNLNRLNVGMTKQQVINVLGDPESASAKEGVEYFRYCLPMNRMGGWKDWYFVRLENNKVVAYGRVGDFGYTRPANEATLNLNVKQQDSNQ